MRNPRLPVSILCALLILVAGARAGQNGPPLLLRSPTLSETQVVFSFAGDLWSVPREGGDARRLTSHPGTEIEPRFSPDGRWVAFTGEYEGNRDVYVVPAEGGVPRRLTYHPGTDSCRGWTPDGKRVLFLSARDSASGIPRLFTLGLDETVPEPLPLPVGAEGAFSPDGSRLAYVPVLQAQGDSWKRYAGGQTTPIWLVNLKTLDVEKVPRENSNDSAPMWVGEKLSFLSDRDGPVSLYAYDTRSRRVARLVKNGGLDMKSASAGPGAIVYEQFGGLYLFDLGSSVPSPLRVRVAGDLPEVRARLLDVSDRIASADLSPSGARALFEARGEILTVPAEKGNPRNLTGTSAAAERSPAWSPEGRSIAYYSDESGEYHLHVRDAGGGEPRKIGLSSPPTFYYNLRWSPDSKKIAFSDRRLTLHIAEVESGDLTQVAENRLESWDFEQAWSPDSRWLAYVRLNPNRMGQVMVYSVEGRASHPVSDGMSDAELPQFDRSGKYLYFAASTDSGPALGGIDLSASNQRVTRSLYLTVLRKDLPSPLAPESDEEKGAPAAGTGPAKPEMPAPGPEPVRIDLEGLDQRVLALPLPARDYALLRSGKAGVLFIGERIPRTPGMFVQRFDLATRKAERYLEGVARFALAASGEKALVQQGQQWAIHATAGAPAPGAGSLTVSGMQVRLDPRAEWRQMYREVWRIERDFFYDPNHHGLDLAAAERRYAPYLEGLASRADLNYLFEEMLGELTVGHMFIGGGDIPKPKEVPGGLLGADYAVENGRYRFKRVYSGENWNPDLRAPLTAPGVGVTVGEYLLAVNGRDLRQSDNLYSLFEGTSGRQVSLKVGADPGGAGARDVTMVPIARESGLRRRAGFEENRRKVDRATDGRVAYIYLPDTGTGGYTEFNRYFFAQVNKQGAIIDERFNGGGKAADYIIDYLNRPLMNFWATRYGEPYPTPYGAIHGPKVMLINEYGMSGGDAMPWYFRRAGIGPLIGTRTWGGLVGIGGYPQLVDGGFVTAPHFAFYTPEGKWEVENRGVAPDIEVELDPKSFAQGKDPQLERAIEWVLDALKKNPPKQYRRPEYPNYHPKRGSRRP